MSDAEERLQAALAHRRAADDAFAATSWEVAASEYEAALTAGAEAGGSDDPSLDEAAILTRLGSCYWSMSQARTAWRSLRRAMQLFRERGDGPGLARATVEITRIWGPWERQLAMSDEALEMLGPEGEPYLRARLLLATAWRERNDRFDQAMAIAREHGFRDILAEETEDQSRQAYYRDGDIERAIELGLRAHEEFVAAGAHEGASNVLRGIGFHALEQGMLDRGSELARRCVEYSRRVHLKFNEELALIDLAAVSFGRADYAGCEALLGELTTNTDFRGDLYRMWMLERSGDRKQAVQMMVDPERAGRAATGLSQTHGAAAGVMFRAGLHEPAARELEEWARIAGDSGERAVESPVLFECIVGLGDEALLRAIADSFGTWHAPRPMFATLSGRAFAPAHGGVLLRLGRADEAEAVYGEGLAWCERERMPIDAGLCLRGLADVAASRGDDAAADGYRSRARGIFEEHGARLYLDEA